MAPKTSPRRVPNVENLDATTEEQTPTATQVTVVSSPPPQPATTVTVDKAVLAEAPPMFSWTPSPKEIEAFRTEELAWRKKLLQQ
jgi:hypothetical protein